MAFVDLRADVESWAIRSDFPTSIYNLATARINRSLRVQQMLEQYSEIAAREITLPTNFLAFDQLKGTTSGYDFPIDPVTPYTMASGDNPSGVPEGYSIANGLTGRVMRLNPAPSGPYPLSGMYFAKLANLVNDADTNLVLEDFPDIYLSACLAYAFGWMQDTEQMTIHSQNMATQIDLANQEYSQNRYSAPLQSVPVNSA